ncbi:MAG: SLBB domain-containing protein [Bacteroidota bacterium]|nr:SLBB domain-containing protein [Bacteroidota bacterium]
MKLYQSVLACLVLTAALCGNNSSLFAQDVNPNTVQVNSLSDDQIKAIQTKAQQSGMSQTELEAAARAKGYSQSDIDKLKSRMNGTSTSKTTSSDATQTRERTYTEQDNTSNPAQSKRDSIKERLFGYSLFNNKNLSFTPNLNIPTPKNYQLGTGDDVYIDIWGASQQTYHQKINPEGNLIISNVGPIYINGMTIEEATGKIKNELSKIYAGLRAGNTFLKVSLGAVRSIKVNIVGDITTPGTYTLPSLATVFNALYVAGGPSINGTLRSVKVIRSQKTVADLDFYDFLLKGELPHNMRLEDQDVIFISSFKNRVSVNGEVRRPGLYDVKSTETLKDLIYFAGGYTSQSFAQQLQVVRKTSKEMKVIDLLASQIDTFHIANGDEIVVGKIYKLYENRVQIKGAVYRPGIYALNEASSIQKLLKKADGLQPDAFKNRILIFRLRDDYTRGMMPVDLSGNDSIKDVQLQREDSVVVSSIFDLRDTCTVSIDGEIRHPGTYKFAENSTVEDIVIMAGGFTEAASFAHLEVARRIKDNMAINRPDQVAEIFQFPIGKDLKLDAQASKFILQPFDQVFIRRSPGYIAQTLVKIDGEVAFAGNYSIKTRDERISDLIKRSGGLTSEAFPAGAKLTRQLYIDKEARQKALKHLSQQRDSSLMLNEIQETQSTLAINLDKILAHPGSDYDLFLQEGDVLSIPKKFQTVRLTGAVMLPVLVRYQRSNSLSNYVSMAGGFADNAQKRKSYVIYPNGEVKSTKRFLFCSFYPKVLPGSEIVVPRKPEHKKMSTGEIIGLTSSVTSVGVMIVTLITYLKK